MLNRVTEVKLKVNLTIELCDTHICGDLDTIIFFFYFFVLRKGLWVLLLHIHEIIVFMIHLIVNMKNISDGGRTYMSLVHL